MSARTATATAFALAMALGAGIGRAQEAPAGAAAREPRWGIAPVLSYSAGRIAARSEVLPDLDYDAFALSLRLLAY